MERTEGFEDQRLSVLPRPLVAAALTRPVTRRMLVTDAGWFPHAERHGRHRPRGADETIVIVCAAGSGWVDTGGVRERVAPGAAVVIPSAVPHAYGATPGDAWTIWWCHVRGTDVAELVEATGAAPGRVALSLRASERVIALLDEISLALSRDTTPATLTAASGMAWRLLTQLAVDRMRPEAGSPLQRAMRYLEERIDGHIAVPELAGMVGVSASHLSALFREATGGGVIAYHSALKMARARTLLDTTDLSVADIGRRVGMDDPFYFSRRFRAVHGMSPRAYRATHKG
ncbi:helix-turn-helix domain-containing protein [Microbacterium thalassium]|uniref:AraC-like DNA-binding protein n=1 Tax=Microbacterium thalassium TaxID=362649 RepID=A0A7X0FP18_9MICO|nr:AraC family transcriptional regulator [Microbacterium thalassium]MBB6390565.1 AraC-like DNA-binding protein [Microbacterium thalassium]